MAAVPSIGRRRFPQVLADDEGGLRRETHRTPSAELEAQIDQLLAVGVGEDPRAALSQLAKLGARLIIQRAVEEEFDAWLGRARYERRPDGPEGMRNGFRPRTLQTAEGELSVEIPQVREAAAPFVSKLFARATKLLRTEPLKALVIGAFVRGLTSSRSVKRRDWAASRGPPRRGCAPSCAIASRRSSAAISTRSGSSRCSSTRPSWPRGPAARRRACSSPGASPTPANACCCR